MSDAHSDLTRSDDRFQARKEYYECLLGYLRQPSEVGKEELRQAEVKCEAIKFGVSRSSIKHSGIEHLILRLQQGNMGMWAHVIYRASEYGLRDEFRDVSPLKDKVLMEVRYNGRYHVELGFSQVQNLVDQRIQDEDFMAFGADCYFLAIPEEKLQQLVEESDVVWVGSRDGVARNKNGGERKNG